MSPPKMAPDGVQGWFLTMSPVTLGPFSASPWHPKIDQKSISSGKVDPRGGVFPVLRRFSVLGSFVGLLLVNFGRKFDVFFVFFGAFLPFLQHGNPHETLYFQSPNVFFDFCVFHKIVKTCSKFQRK